MGMVVDLVCVEKKYTYQHIQGVMLVNLNKIAFETNLSHSAYRVAGFLISNYNLNSGTAYPSIEIIAKACCMSKSTVIKNIEALVAVGLIIAVKESGKLARYSFTKNLLAGLTGTSCKTTASTACKTIHDMKQNKTKNKISTNSLLILYNDELQNKFLLSVNSILFKALLNPINYNLM